MISGPTETRGILSLGQNEANKGENPTEWDLELRCKPNMLTDLNYAIRGIIQEPLKMKDYNWRKHFDENLLARLAEARRTDLHRLQVCDTCKCVFYGVHRIVLLDIFDFSY
jgi:hypothetical protein